jgi:hypothetical protein
VIPHLKAIATNSLNKPIAVEFFADFHKWAHDEDEPEGGWYSIPEKQGTRLSLFPVTDEYHTESAIELLLKKAMKFEEIRPLTSYNVIEIPGGDAVKKGTSKQKRQASTPAIRHKKNLVPTKRQNENLAITRPLPIRVFYSFA